MNAMEQAQLFQQSFKSFHQSSEFRTLSPVIRNNPWNPQNPGNHWNSRNLPTPVLLTQSPTESPPRKARLKSQLLGNRPVPWHRSLSSEAALLGSQCEAVAMTLLRCWLMRGNPVCCLSPILASCACSYKDQHWTTGHMQNGVMHLLIMMLHINPVYITK